MNSPKQHLINNLWRIYNRPHTPRPFAYGGNLPYDDPAFSERMLTRHLDPTDPAGSRIPTEITAQLPLLTKFLNLKPQDHLLDLTCGPALYAVPFAKQGIHVTGIDFAPAAIYYAKELADKEGVAHLTTFHQADILEFGYPASTYDTALLLYGQFAVMPKPQAQRLLTQLASSLKPGGTLLLEMLNPAHVDKTNSTWWFTDDTGLWGDTPFLHLGERFWDAETNASVERYQILNLDTGNLTEIQLADQVYAPPEIKEMAKKAGFSAIEVADWGDIVADTNEWLVYLLKKE